MKIIRILFVIFLIQKAAFAGGITVTANVRDVKLLNFYYNDAFFDLKSNVISKPDNSGNFVLNIDLISYPAIVACEFYGTHLPFLAFEGQTYILKRNADSTLYVENQGRNVSEIYSSLEKKAGTFRVFNYKTTAPADAYMMIQSADHRKHQRDSVLAKAKLTGNSLVFYKQLISYAAILEKLLPFIQANQPDYNYQALPADYVQDLNRYTNAFNRDDLLNNDIYRLSAYFYNSFLSKSNNTFEAAFENAVNHFSGQTRNMILFRLLKENIKKQIPDFNKYFEKYSQLDKNSMYRHYIDSLYNMYQKPMSDEMLATTLIDTDDNKLALREFLKRHQDAVIYIDIWASWCVPCRAEFYFSEKLQSNIKNSRMVFLYLSIDRDRAAWQKANADYTFMNKANSFFIEGDISAPLLKQLKITSIPRYLIMDANGFLLDDNAPRPSSPELKGTLTKMLN